MLDQSTVDLFNAILFSTLAVSVTVLVSMVVANNLKERREKRRNRG